MDKPALRVLAEQDQVLEQDADRTGFALMEHRWTAIHVHGYGVREYARAISRDPMTISRYVRAWQMRLDGVAESATAGDLLERANGSVQRNIAVDAVARIHGVGMAQARQRHMPEVRRVLAAIAEADDKQAKADAYVDAVMKSQAAQRADKDRKRASSTRSMLDLETELDKARRALRQAVLITKEATSLDETWHQHTAEIMDEVEHLCALLNLALTDSSGVDWDAEMGRLVEGR